ncbi:MAG: UDP-N-acetylglucosamine--N-acetylmuramyl-(pentapeptide) pyrophosphoryl-undecaprenol N-acetylglucosamine transferase, partial [Candidatus Latescibacteria bacterium]|nr:UDP-N-acetylglucosamine--N-acetylmuramyl-(pentapeptide) pyrophosphoryl-undecaprenol N-acetylglucosamine transferase [Candidatus Latescibacterota bacterium]
MQPAPPQSATDAMTQTLRQHPVQSDATPCPHEHPDRPPQTYVFTGGGSGGHVNPALAIADGIKSAKPNSRIEYIGARGKIEAELVPTRGYPIHLVHARGLPSRKKLLPLLAFALVTGLGILQCLTLILKIKPDIIVATGGYASSPVLFALWILRTLHLTSARCFIHEQNVVPGLVNRIAGRIADRIGVSFLETARFFHPSKVVHVGYPIRKEISSVHREQARQDLKIPEQSTVIFAFGGSQGARSINRGLIDALPELLCNKRIYIFHVLGIQDSPEYHAEDDASTRIASLGMGTEELSRYHSMRYAHDIQTYYAASDVIIGRAGAGTVTEICAGGRPSILIPLPNAPGDHQALNARTLESGGAAYVLYEEATLEEGRPVGTVDGQQLSRLILQLDESPQKRKQMGESALRLFDKKGLERIMGELTFPAFTPNQDSPLKSTMASDLETVSTMTPFQLLRKLDADEQTTIETIGHGYLRYKADGYLTNERWQVRNVGVKIAGILKYQKKLPLLLSMLRDRTPVSRVQRLFGGDFQQVG